MQLLGKIRQFILMATMIACALAIPEIVARIFIPSWAPPVSDKPSHFIPNPYTGWLHPPSSPIDNRGEEVFSNSLGLREKELGEKIKPRLLFLGDSFTWGWGVSNAERYSNRLEALLPQLQIINAGITGFGTLQEYLLLKHYADQLQPDYVVLQLYKNDFSDNLTPDGAYTHPFIDVLDNNKLAHYPAKDPSVGLFLRSVFYIGEHTYFYRQLLIHLYRSWLSLHIDTHEHRPEVTETQLVHGMELSLGMLYKYCAEEKIPIIVFVSDLESYQLNAVRSISQLYSVDVYNLSDTLSTATKEYRLSDHTGHWNAYGNELVANDMHPHIVSMISSGKKNK